jgi:hypothetical protein
MFSIWNKRIEKTGTGYAVGNKMTIADFKLLHVMNTLVHDKEIFEHYEKGIMDNYPFLKKHMDEKKNETGGYFEEKREKDCKFSDLLSYYLGDNKGCKSVKEAIIHHHAEIKAGYKKTKFLQISSNDDGGFQIC